MYELFLVQNKQNSKLKLLLEQFSECNCELEKYSTVPVLSGFLS